MAQLEGSQARGGCDGCGGCASGGCGAGRRLDTAGAADDGADKPVMIGTATPGHADHSPGSFPQRVK